MALPNTKMSVVFYSIVLLIINNCIEAISVRGDYHRTGFHFQPLKNWMNAWWGTDGHWRMLVGSLRKRRGINYLYRSKDFMTWVRAKLPIHSKGGTGMWECPDIYPVSVIGNVVGNPVKHVFKNSLDDTGFHYYNVGTYLEDKDRYVPDNTSVDGWGGLRSDYGSFYASKAFFDHSKNWRILWGWENESDEPMDIIRKGWAGIQAIPRFVWLDFTGKQWVQRTVEESTRSMISIK